MFKKEITYTDYNGNVRTEPFYFNLNKAEILKLAARYPGGLDNYLKDIFDKKDMARLLDFFEELVLSSYGRKSDDGRRFIKSKEIRDEFMQSEAYSTFLMEILSDPTGGDKANEFMHGIIPESLLEEANRQNIMSLV